MASVSTLLPSKQLHTHTKARIGEFSLKCIPKFFDTLWTINHWLWTVVWIQTDCHTCKHHFVFDFNWQACIILQNVNIATYCIYIPYCMTFEHATETKLQQGSCNLKMWHSLLLAMPEVTAKAGDIRCVRVYSWQPLENCLCLSIRQHT